MLSKCEVLVSILLIYNVNEQKLYGKRIAMLCSTWLFSLFLASGQILAEEVNSKNIVSPFDAHHSLKSDKKNDTTTIDTSVALDGIVLTGRKKKSNEGCANSGYRTSKSQFGPLGELSQKETPFSINVTSGEQIHNRNAHTATEALKTNPTVSSLMLSNGYSSMSRVMVRGFTAADQSDLRDGITDRSFTVPPVEDLERIEVLNGLSSFLHGFSSIGGTVNYVPKQPVDTVITSIEAGQYDGLARGTDGIRYCHTDLGGPIVPGNLTYRLNLYTEKGPTYIDKGKIKRTFISTAVNYMIIPGVGLKTDFYQQNYNEHGLQTYFNVNPSKGIHVPDALDPTIQYGQSWTYNESEKSLYGATLHVNLIKALSNLNISEFFDKLEFRSAYRYGDMWRKYCLVGATFLDDTSGNYSLKYTDSPRQNETTNAGYGLLDVGFTTSDYHHDITLGYTANGYQYSRGADTSRTLGILNVDSQVYYSIPFYAPALTTTWQEQTMSSIIGSYRIGYKSVISMLFGVNFAKIDQKAWGIGTGISMSKFSQEKFTPSFSLLGKPLPGLSLYASYIQGLSAGGVAPKGAKNANDMLAPSASDQYEVGIKTTIRSLDIATAFFRINKINEYTDSRDNVYKQDGQEIHQGIELTFNGNVTHGLSIGGGGTVLNSDIFNGNFVFSKNNHTINAALEGKHPVNVPDLQGRIWLEYSFPEVTMLEHVTLTGGVNYNGKRFVDALNTDEIDDATSSDLGIRYEPQIHGHKARIALNITNVFNTWFWSYYRNGDGLILDKPRLVSLAAGIEW
jgi:iron complex outermembrane receptor protein